MATGRVNESPLSAPVAGRQRFCQSYGFGRSLRVSLRALHGHRSYVDEFRGDRMSCRIGRCTGGRIEQSRWRGTLVRSALFVLLTIACWTISRLRTMFLTLRQRHELDALCVVENVTHRGRVGRGR